MAKAINNQTNMGDIHAPVEDTQVPFFIKLLVIVMFLLIVGMGVLIGLTIYYQNLHR